MNKTTDKFSVTKTNNDTRLFHESRSTPPVTSIVAMVKTGSSKDPAPQSGLSYLTARALASRTADRSMTEFNEFTSSRGFKISSTVHPDFTEFSFTTTNDHLEELIELIPPVLSELVLTDELFDHLRKKQLSALDQRQDNTFRHAFDRALEAFYGDHPYNHPPIGKIESVQSLEREDIQSFYEREYRIDDLVVSSVGTATLYEMEEMIDRIDMPGRGSDSTYSNEDLPNRNRVVEDRDLDQPTHVLFYEAPTITEDNYVHTNVLDALMGGRMGSLLFDQMREQRSLGYQVGTSYPSRCLRSTFRIYLGGGSPDAEEFLSVLSSIQTRLAEEGPNQQRLEEAKRYLTGNFNLSHETHKKTAWYRAFYEIMGRGYKFDENYTDQIRSTSVPDIRKTCQSLFDNKERTFVTIKPIKE